MISLATLVVALVGLVWIGGGRSEDREQVVYCAAAVRPVIAPLVKQYQAERGAAVSMRVGPSGDLEAQIRLAERGDLFLPASADPFLDRLDADGLIAERLPLASLQLVLVLAPGAEERPGSLRELMESGLRYALCNEQAAAGQKAREAAGEAGLWEPLSRGATANFPTVTELAAAVRDSGRLQAGLVWGATADQFGLRRVDLPELSRASGRIEIGVLTTAADRSAAGELARFLANQAGAFEAAGFQVP